MEEKIGLGGSSGSRFYVYDDILRKVNHGKGSLVKPFLKQLEASKGGCFPFNSPKPFDLVCEDDESFKMPFIKGVSFNPSSFSSAESSMIEMYLTSNKGIESGDFRSLVRLFLKDRPDSFMKEDVLQLLNECPDNYLKGFCHGDFGPDNIIFNKDNGYLIDFTEAYIDSILFDVAILTRFLRMNGSDAAVGLNNYILDLFKDYSKQIEILGKLRAIRFFSPLDQNVDSYFKKWFYI